MSQQVDPAAAVHIAQQEMEYRVDLFNKYVHSPPIKWYKYEQNLMFSSTRIVCAEWCPLVMTSA